MVASQAMSVVFRALQVREGVPGVLSRQHYPTSLLGESFVVDVSVILISVGIYTVSRLLPVVIVMVPFIAVVVDTGLLGRVDDCSCWCYPSLGNVMPYAYNRDKVLSMVYTE